MALVLKDRVKETSTTAGTGTITLAGAVTGFQSFSAIGNGNTTYYAIVDNATGAWEVGIGTYTSSGTTLSRTTVLSSSNGGSLVSFAANSKDVFVTYPSEQGVWTNASGVVAQTSFGAITATSAALTSGTITTAPSNSTDIVNKEYADSISSGLNYHQPVIYASTAALPAYTYNNGASGVGATITANANGALSMGGGSPSATQRVLVKDETGGNAAYNGVYVVTQAGSAGTPFILTRATDYDTSGTGTNEIDQGDYVLVISGTLASTAWVQQTPLPITVGTTALTFLQFNAPITYNAGTGLNLSPATTFNISNTGVTASTYGSASAVPVFAVNAQGQITSVTNTNIAINGSAVSGNISGQAGSVANSLTAGTYLTGTAYNGSAAQTWTVDATSANTASKVVARDASGNFSAGTITAALSGNATTATTATNVAGGTANQIVYNTSAGTTSFAAAPSASGQLLNWNGSAYSWVSPIPTTSGGTGLTSFTSGGVVYASSTSALTTGSALSFNGTTFTAPNSVITSSSSSDALRITQTGTGNALLVEDSANPDSTPVVIDTNGKVVVGYTAPIVTSGSFSPLIQSVANTQTAGFGTSAWINSTAGGNVLFAKSRSGTIGTFGIVSSGDDLGAIRFDGDDGTQFVRAAQIIAAVDGTPGTNDMPGRLVFSTTADGAAAPTERMRITNTGSIGIGGTPTTGITLDIQKAQTGATTATTVAARINPDSTVTSIGYGFATYAINGVGTSTTNIFHYHANQGTYSGTAPTTQYGFSVSSSLTGATNNYGFYGNIASGTGRYNLYMAGTADNYFAGDVIINGKIGIGTAGSPSYGTSGQVLTSAGSGSAPTWSNVTLPPVSLNDITISSSYTFPANKNAISVGPVTIGSGVTVTVGSGQRWLVV